VILYDLKCRKDHVFETWFRDSGAYDEQAAAGAIACPVCGSKKIEKALMAPRLAKGGRARDDAEAAAKGGTEGGTGTVAVKETAAAAELMNQLRELRRKVEETCDYVGGNFAEEARKIHYGEQDPRNIYGETSDQQAKELRDEGVTFSRVPWAPRQDS
jgi:hypothetical protein